MQIQIIEQLDRQGVIYFEHRRKGLLLGQYRFKNLITDAGRALYANLGIAAGTAPSHIAIGTGTTPAAVGDTVMEAEVYREAATRSQVTIVVTNDGSQYLKTFSILATYNFSEAGLLNNAAGGTLSCHRIFTAIPCLNGDTLKTTWRVRN